MDKRKIIDRKIIGPRSLNYLFSNKLDSPFRSFNNKKIYLWHDYHDIFYKQKMGDKNKRIGIQYYIWNFVKMFTNSILYLELPINIDQLNIQGHQMSLYAIYTESSNQTFKNIKYVDKRNRVSIGLLAEKLRHHYPIVEDDLKTLQEFTIKDVEYFIETYSKYLKEKCKDFKNKILLDTVINYCMDELRKTDKINENILEKIKDLTVDNVNESLKNKKTENPIVYIEPIVAIIMDIYVILTMSITKNEHQIFYGGSAHSTMISNILIKFGLICKEVNELTIQKVEKFVEQNNEKNDTVNDEEDYDLSSLFES